MHNNYFFLRQLSKALESRISGFVVDSCFSQNKDELVFQLVRNHDTLWIKADLKSRFSCLSFPDEFIRARKNSIDLFPETIGLKVLEVIQFDHERAFAIRLEDDHTLLFKLFGNFSNILLFKQRTCINVFKHGTGDETRISMERLHHKPTPLMAEEGLTLEGLKKRITAFDKPILAYLVKHGFRDDLDKDAQQKLVSDVLSILQNPSFYVISEGPSVKLSLLPEVPSGRRFSDPMEALNHLYSEYHKRFWLAEEKNRLNRQLSLQAKKTGNYLRKTEGKLQELREAGNYQQMADIIMANLNTLKTGQEKAELYDFYNDKVISIQLKRNLNPQRNAARYYRKAKNQKIEISTLEKNIRQKKIDLGNTREYIETIAKFSDMKQLRSFAIKNNLIKTSKESPPETPRFKMYDHMGFRILVGRNAKNNDELTFQYGYKEDLWLHAKDVKGSHVLIKYQSGQNFPKPVIRYAAELAGYYSGNKNANTCPVIFTPRKYVRKSKGLPAGAVMVDKEEIIFVNPREHKAD